MKESKDNGKLISIDELKKQKFLATNDNNKKFSCPSCNDKRCFFRNGFLRIRNENEEYVQPHFVHSSDDIDFCPLKKYRTSDLTPEKKECIEKLKSDFMLFLERWREILNEDWVEHISKTMTEICFENFNKNYIKNENRYIYIFNNKKQYDTLKNIINKHNKTDDLIFIFNIKEYRCKYVLTRNNKNDKIYIQFKEKNEMPLFVNYEHNYTDDRTVSKPIYPNVNVFLDCNKDHILKINFYENFDQSYEVLPLDYYDLLKEWRGVLLDYPYKEKWIEVHQLLIERNKNIIQEFKNKNIIFNKKCNKCYKPFEKIGIRTSCKKCNTDYRILEEYREINQ